MKLEILPDAESLCDQCVALCCRYYAFQIETPKTKRDFEDMRWFLLHEDSVIYVEDKAWYLQVNRKCKELLPDNRCGIYHNRPTICREYSTNGCDWHALEYNYDHLFTEPEHLEKHGAEVFARQRRRKRLAAQRKATKRTGATKKAPGKKKVAGSKVLLKPRIGRRGQTGKQGVGVSLRKSA